VFCRGIGKTGDFKGYPFGTQLCNAKCSVLYLLARLAGKMSVSPDGNAYFAWQENGQCLRMGIRKHLGGLGSGRRYMWYFY